MPQAPDPAEDAGDVPSTDGTPADVPSVEALRRTVAEQEPLLTGPPLHDSVTVRVRRVLTAAAELLDLLGDDTSRSPSDDPSLLARDTVARAVTWVVESVGAHQRLPSVFAAGHAVEGEHPPLLALVDDLDLLGLTIDHAYDAAHRGDLDHARDQHEVLRARFGTNTRPERLVDETGVRPEHVDEQVVDDHGLQVGDDGIPRLPVPEQPDPHHVPAPTGAGPDGQTQEDM